MGTPLVTVLCITYNQALYVRDMLEGLVRQKTTFEVEYIIHDDASTDGTQKILKEYEEKYPGKFNIIYQKENQWSKGVKITQRILTPLIRGKYVAFCEGDDFWLDANKLQEQADFLEAHPEYVCVAHNSLRLDMSNGKIIPFSMYETSQDVKPCDLVNRKFPYLATASKMHRKEAFVIRDEFFLESGEIGDVCADYYAITKGKIYYIDKIMSLYRFGAAGSYSDRVRNVEHNLRERAKFYRFLCKYNQYTDGKYKFYIGLYMSRTLNHIAHQIQLQKIGYDKFQKMVHDIGQMSNGIYRQSLTMIEKVIGLYNYSCAEQLCKEVQELVEEHQIYIYGAGDYGTRMANVLLNSGIDFAGFVVSDITQNNKVFLGKPVIDVSAFVPNKDKAKLVISLDAENWQDVWQTLDNLDIRDYICPFYIEPEDYED